MKKLLLSAVCAVVLFGGVADVNAKGPRGDFDGRPSIEEMKKVWAEFKGYPQEAELPSAPKQFLNYFEEDNRPQTKLQRNLENGMAVSIGRLREDSQFDYKFVCLSHNTLRGAAGGAVLMAEQLCAQNYITPKFN